MLTQSLIRMRKHVKSEMGIKIKIVPFFNSIGGENIF